MATAWPIPCASRGGDWLELGGRPGDGSALADRFSPAGRTTWGGGARRYWHGPRHGQERGLSARICARVQVMTFHKAKDSIRHGIVPRCEDIRGGLQRCSQELAQRRS